MKSLIPYLTFDGNTREAMTFYHQCLGGDLNVQTFADMKMDAQHPESANRVIHAKIQSGALSLMASDSPAGQAVTSGDNFSICLDCDTAAEAEKLFAALGAGGKVVMPMADMFWGARWGMTKDKFGIMWMLNADGPKQEG